MCLSDLIQNIGLIVASVTAWYGINEWRRELRGKREYELAEEVLALFYECRDHIRYIRNPFAREQEGSTRKVEPNETELEHKARNQAYVVYERFNKNHDAFARLFALRYRFEALFGRESVVPILDLKRALDEVFISADILSREWQKNTHLWDEKKLEQYSKNLIEQESIFWGTFSQNDKFNTKVEEIVARMDYICSRILRPESRWNRVCDFFVNRRKK